MFDPLVLRSEMDFYTQEIPERSVDDFLDNTENFREWARSKRKGTDLDPENRRPVQVKKKSFRFIYSIQQIFIFLLIPIPFP